MLAVTFNDTSDQILSGGIDNDIKVPAGLQYTQKTLEMMLWKMMCIENDYENSVKN